MPRYSASRYGNYSVTVPAYAVNVTLTVGGAGGGGSASSTGGWNHSNGGNGRVGDFRLATRDYDYTLSIYLGEKGGKGNGPAKSGRGSGGRSAVAGGGNGHRSGGGGGGASAVYDGGLNRYVITVGGGGGAGRYATSTGTNYPASGAGIGGGRTTGNWGHRGGQTASAGHRGGGGGGADSGGFGSSGGAQTTNGYAGIGGNSRMYTGGGYYDWTTNSGYANSGDGYYILNFDYAPPTIQYFTISPQLILQGDTAELSWGVAGAYNQINIDPGFSNLERQGTRTVSPQLDTQYNLTVTGPGGNANQLASIDVLIPPDVTLFSDATNNTIVLGESVNLSWTITGDASTAQMSPGVGEVNISGGPVTVTPTVDTVYTLTASHPIAGQDSDQVEIIVLQPPTVSLSGPVSVDYGQNITLSLEATNATTSLQLLAIYHYEDNPGSSYEIVEEFGVAEQFNGQEELIVPYTDFGPNRIEYRLYAIGAGGLTDEADIEVDINIDRTPDALSVPEVADAIKNEDPVISPDQEVTSVQLVVDDIDVPVKIKADYPIQVEIDDDGVYRNVEEI